MSYPYLIQGDNIVINVGHKVYTVNKGNVSYNKMLECIKNGDWNEVINLVDPKKIIINYGKGNISIKGEEFYWKDTILDNAVSHRIIKMLIDGFDVQPMVAFMDNLMQNPSNTAITELYLFLEKNNLPITPDGCFLAYKKVTSEYLDFYTKTIDNSIGKVVEMERNMVNDDRNQTCSHGLHFCSREYLNNFQTSKTDAHIMILKINPCDVVSIPRDYNNSKGRCCKYEVIAELDVDHSNIEEKPVYEDLGLDSESYRYSFDDTNFISF